MFNSYVFKSTFKEEKELIFKVMPNYPKSEEIDYTALDLLCYMIRTNIIFDSYQRAYVPRSYEEWNNYVAELDVLLKVRQDEIVDKIIEPVTAEWIISPYPSNASYHWNIRSDRVIGNYFAVNMNLGVRPTIYLTKTTRIISGNGTSGSPYIIG